MNTIVNNISKLVLVCILIMPMGCEDLEENPDFITQDNFFTTAEQLVQGVNAVYDGLGEGRDWFNHFYNRYVFECRVGYQVGWEKGPLDFQNGNVDPGDAYISTYWRISYENINRANSVIEKADELTAAGTPNGALIERVKAEAMFLRAFYYFNLVRYFDNVPVTTQRTVSDQDLPSNENGKQVALELIENDLTAAAGVLPEVYEGADVGRATSWAAKALLVKAYLQDEKWTQALTTADDIVTNANISLFDDFSHNFDVAHENSGERIFEAQVSASANSAEFTNHHAHFVPGDLPNSEGGVGWHWLNGTQEFRKSYDDDDKRIPATFIGEYTTTRLGENTAGELPKVTWSPDAAYDLSRFGGMVRADVDPDDTDNLIFGTAWTAKWVEAVDNFNNTERNVVYLRYADVLLGHSEAANESGTGDPLFGINLVRERAGLTPLAGLSQSDLRDAIVNERVQEFAFEQETYPELKRKSTFGGSPDYLGDFINNFITTYNVDRQLTAKDYVLPIPQNEILGNPNVQQNEPYR
ncbi:RagB/SusD family nutrient uptake outer membrane protein [Fulvivirgaceae bacterium BMA12]|uniref:RagB/SusD family nutrient uptake outer membrane protein n=1 Tax=Agaribacillus aureus TaxID=3051825 RepID=A0ABT8L4S4_9BACT|nr:RagB/SusD family nutrient uptake outer membrane protein [Fulvivirgaceae bacterium BMA12]